MDENFRIHNATARVCKHFAFFAKMQNQFTMCKFHVIYIAIWFHFRSSTFVCWTISRLFSAHPYAIHFISFHSIWFSLSRRRALESKWSKFDMFPLRNAIHHQIYCENISIAFPCCSPLTWFTVSLLHRNELNHRNGILPTFGRFCSDSISCRFSSALYSLG